MDFLVLVKGALTLVLVIVLWLRKRFSYWKQLGVPYEEPHFFYGNLKGVGQFDHDGRLLQRFYRKHKGKGPIAGVYVYLKPVAILLDVDFLKNVLIKDFNYFKDRGVFFNEKDDPLSGCLCNLDADRWKQMRNRFLPAFTNGNMETKFEAMRKVAQIFEKKIDQVCRSGKELDIKKLAARFTVDIIGNCVFGLETNSLEDEDNDFFRIGMSVFENPRYGTRFTFALHNFREWARKLRIKLFHDDVLETYSNIVQKAIDDRLANPQERNDLIELLIRYYTGDGKDKLQLNELLAQAFVIHLSGCENSSTILQFCFYELACNSDIQGKLRHHINEVLENHNGKLTYEAVTEMKYLDQVVNETCRMYPPYGVIFRETNEDYKIPCTDITLEKGTKLYIPLYAIHHDPEFYPNPSKFNPDNFSEEAVKGRPSTAFVPFGTGPRTCMAARYAMMQIKIGVITALRKFKYTLSPRTKHPIKLRTKFSVTQPEGRIWLNAESVD